MAKKKVVAGVLGDTKYYFDDKGIVVDGQGNPAPKAIAAAFLAGIDTIPAPADEPKPTTTKQPSSDLPKLTNKIARTTGGGAVGTAAGMIGGTLKNIAGSASSDISRSIGLSALKPTNILSSISESMGVGGLVPALATASAGREGGKEVKAAVDSSSSVLETLQDNNEILLDILAAITGNKRDQIEASREAAKIGGAIAPAGVEGEAPPAEGGGGGILGGLGGFLKGGLSKMLGPIMGMFSMLAPILSGLASFAGTIMLPLAVLGGILYSLEAQDWGKLFGNLGNILGDLAEGNWIDALIGAIFTIPDILITGFGRLIANILSYFGFDEWAEKLNEVLDNFNLVQTMKDLFHGISDWLSAAFTTAKETIIKWWDATINFPQTVIDWATALKEKIVNAFPSWDTIGAVFTDLYETITGFFKKLPSTIINSLPDWFPGKSTMLEALGAEATAASTAATVGSDRPSSISPRTEAIPENKILTPNQLTAMPSMQTVEPKPTGRASVAWDTKYGATHNADGTPKLQLAPEISPMANPSAKPFIQQSSFAAMATATPPAPIIINNNSGGGAQSGGLYAPPRTSGGALTAPIPSHADVAIYGLQVSPIM